jgi:hypothetical protein
MPVRPMQSFKIKKSRKSCGATCAMMLAFQRQKLHTNVTIPCVKPIIYETPYFVKVVALPLAYGLEMRFGS